MCCLLSGGLWSCNFMMHWAMSYCCLNKAVHSLVILSSQEDGTSVWFKGFHTKQVLSQWLTAAHALNCLCTAIFTIIGALLWTITGDPCFSRICHILRFRIKKGEKKSVVSFSVSLRFPILCILHCSPHCSLQQCLLALTLRLSERGWEQ